MNAALKALALVTMVVLPMCISVPSSRAQSVNLAGSWSLVSLTVTRSGTEEELLGPHPEGLLMFGNDGRYALVGVRTNLPKFASGSRLQGTADENARIVQGNVAHFGTYTVDTAAHVIVFHIQRSTFPNWDADVQSRPFTIDGDRLTYVTPGSFGYGAAKVVWQRMK
ncbi:lipocalin-like domain-containing protein [Paraburkholderia sp. 22B1P]|uniref:lipocalin-like domain-containing protein n=1 Tax=Paraburkholderia sp. 22B1P TaxID=3080498 RepID=UPI00308BEB63|nr:lipocalin-like domain-containing protein [Paraburkholderia sp. 22B1P]